MYGDVLDRLVDRPTPLKDAPVSRTPAAPAAERYKATFYLTREDILAIDGMQSGIFSRTGRKPERSQLVSEAIQLLARQHREEAGA